MTLIKGEKTHQDNSSDFVNIETIVKRWRWDGERQEHLGFVGGDAACCLGA